MREPQISVAPTEYPVTTDQFKAHLRITTDEGTPQKGTVRITANDVTTTYKLTVSIEVVSTAGQAGGVAATATALATAWNASTSAAFTSVTASASGDTVTLTADDPGGSFTAVASVADGAGTIGAYIAVDAAFDYYDQLLAMATEVLQRKAWRQFCTATLTIDFDDFADEIPLPRPPLISVSTVKYYDVDGVQQTLSTDVYEVVIDDTPGFIRLKYNQTWPSVRGHPDDVTITYVAGQAAADVPPRHKQAVLLYAAHLYQQRTLVLTGMTVSDVPMGIMWLLDRAGSAV